MKSYRTSRVLNDEAFFMGLSYNDIIGCGLFLLALMMIGKLAGIQSMLWALILTVSILMALVPVRMNFRRKIIRDSLGYVAMKGTMHVSKNRRIFRRK